VFPALALGLALRDRGVKVVWTGRAEEIESRVAAQERFEFEPLAASGFFGKGLATKVRALLELGRGVFRAGRLLSRLQPRGVVATGGFATAAVLTAAWLGGTPFFLLEQNCVPGRVTRFFSRHARMCFATFPLAARLAGRIEVMGCPLRGEIARTRQRNDGRTVLVLGGSLGARSLNDAGLDCAARLPGLRFIILAGRGDYERVRKATQPSADAKVANCEVIEFTERPWELYERAAVAVSRAGGVVLSELAVVGMPAVLVPFPHAVDKHQDANARYYESTGAGLVLDQERLVELCGIVQELMTDDARRRRMTAAAQSIARPDAAAAIAGRVVECLAA
jgi:UDP-N-acetylglucosamine--N-acetylmuramyl-(pentapeptide) pyrophosphoryl-undecaprenol N-acetylglucosamine transferase